ncbi:MAG TPA: hypothetical protein VMK13_03200 [Streptosporangiaceae bacterium]|nr:hypothetical protein [Streptosporangiaceae bacterium]
MSFLAAGRRRLPSAQVRLLRPDGRAGRQPRPCDLRRARRNWLAAPAFAAALAAAGCASQARVELPRKSGPDVAPAAPTNPRPTERQQAVTAYDGYWQAYAQGMTARNAAAARSILAGYVTSASIPPLIAAYRRDWAAHEIAYGAAVTHVLSVRISGQHATLHDCLDLSRLGVQDDRSGQAVPDSFGLPRLNFYVTLLLSRGRWLVSNMQPVVVPCEP